MLLAVGPTVGVLAGAVQFLGLIRWPFLVPYLARADAEPDASPARKDAIDVVFQSFNRYLGVAVGEHLGFLLDRGLEHPRRRRDAAEHGGAPAARSRRESSSAPSSPSAPSSSWVRSSARAGSSRRTLTPFVYIAWSLWLVATGVALLF